VVRRRFLAPKIVGSNPTAPANRELDRRILWPHNISGYNIPKDNYMNENNYSVYHIGDIRTLVEIRCADGSEGALGFGQVNKIEEIIEFERDYMMKQDFEVLRINRLPHSKRVVLFCGVSRTKEKLIVETRFSTAPATIY
jgi:hypothetical protein